MGKRTWLEKNISYSYLPYIATLTDDAKGRELAQILCCDIRLDWEQRGFTKLTQQKSLMDIRLKHLKKSLGGKSLCSEIH